MPVLPQRAYSEEDKRDMELASGGGERYSYSSTDILNKSVTGKGCQQIHRAVEKPNEITHISAVSTKIIQIFRHFFDFLIFLEHRCYRWWRQGWHARRQQEAPLPPWHRLTKKIMKNQAN